MPNISGSEMADRVQRDNPDLPVLFMSGNAPFADPGWSCLAKPFRYAELLAKVRMALEPKGTLRSSGVPLRETSELPR